MRREAAVLSGNPRGPSDPSGNWLALGAPVALRPRLATGLPCSVLSLGSFPLGVGAYPLAGALPLPGPQAVGVAHLAAHGVVVVDALDKPRLAEAAHGAIDGVHDAPRRSGDIGFGDGVAARGGDDPKDAVLRRGQTRKLRRLTPIIVRTPPMGLSKEIGVSGERTLFAKVSSLSMSAPRQYRTGIQPFLFL